MVLTRDGISLQLMFRPRFAHDQVREISIPRFVETRLRAINSFKPLYDLLRG